MKSSKKIFLGIGILAFCMLCALQTGCQKQNEKIPVTSYSKDAQQIFIEAREKYEFLHREEAEALLKEALNRDPLFAQAHIYRILTCAATDEIEKSVEKATANAYRASEGEQFLIAALKAHYWEKNYAKATKIFAQLLDLYPKDARAHWLLSRVYRDSGESMRAIECCQKAITINTNFAPAYKDLGYRYSAQDDYKKAEAYFQKYLLLNPQEPNSHDCLADLYTKMGRFEEAITHYKRALELDPTFTYSQRKIGINLCFLGKYEEGREVLKEAMDKEVYPCGKVYTMEKIIHSYLYEQDYLKALKAIDKAVQMAIDSGIIQEVAHYQLAKCAIYCELKDYENAQKSLADCRNVILEKNLAPFYKDYYASERLYWEAWVAAKQHKFEKALNKAAEYRARLEAMNDSRLLKYHIALLGHIAMAQEEMQSAFELFENASIDDPLYYYLAASAKDKCGDKEASAKYFRKAANWNTDSLHYALVRQKALARKVMIASPDEVQ